MDPQDPIRCNPCFYRIERLALPTGIRSSPVRVTAQMVEPKTGIQIWADRYDRSLGDIFALQDEITSSVVGPSSRACVRRYGTPTRFGNMCAQMRNPRPDRPPLGEGTLVGKVGSLFASTGTQHGGQETTITSFHSTLLDQGMISVGLPYTFAGLTNMNESTGGSPYGASTLAKTDGSRRPSANELDGARYQGRHVAQITAKLVHEH